MTDPVTEPVKPLPLLAKVGVWLAIGTVIALLLCAILSGCMGVPAEYHIQLNPVTGEGTATLTKVAIVEPLSGGKLAEAVVNTDGGLGILSIIGLLLGGSAGITTLLPKGQAIWKMLFTGGVPLRQKLQGAIALPLPMVSSPPAAHAITDEPRATEKAAIKVAVKKAATKKTGP